MKPISLTHQQVDRLRAEIKHGNSGNVYRRATALLAANQGVAISCIASLLGVTRQTVYNWIGTYSGGERNGGLNDAPRSGRPRVLTDEVNASIVTALASSPEAFGYSSHRWSAAILRSHVEPMLGQGVSNETLRRTLRRIGYSWQGGRYVR